MKILNVINKYDPQDGCLFYRVFLPAEELTRRGHEVRVLMLNDKIPDLKHFEWADVVSFSRCYGVSLNYLLDELKKKGKKIVYDTDDDLEGVPTNNPIKPMIDMWQFVMKQIMDKSDLMTTTTPELAGQLKMRYGRNFEVVPNAIDFERFTNRRGGNSKLKIGWSGGYSHIFDLLMVIDVIDELQREYDFEFYLQGISQSPLRAQIYVWEEQLKRGMIAPQHYEFVHGAIKLWGKLIEMKHFEHIPFYPAGLYPDILREMNLDIGICPLIESEFSRFKSCVKFYEYASVGTFTIASNVLPYSKEVNCLTNEWGTMLKGMIDGVDLRKAKLKEQMEFTLLKRDIRKIGDQWNLLFLNLK